MKVYSAPADLPPPEIKFDQDGRYDGDGTNAAEQAFLDALAAKLRSWGHDGPMTGELVRFPWADGHAVYMVAQAKRAMCLVHCPIGDAWSLPDAYLRGLSQADVRAQIKQRETIKALLSNS